MARLLRSFPSSHILPNLQGFRTAYETDGIVKVTNVLPPERFQVFQEVIRSKFERFLQDGDHDMEKHLGNLHKRDPEFAEFVREPAILDLVEPILGPHIKVFSSIIIGKVASQRNAKVPWHQDGRWWPLEPLKVVTVWLAVTPVSQENGGMEFIPGGHTSGFYPVDERKEEDLFSPQLTRSISPRSLQTSKSLFHQLEPNECTLHDVKLPHRSSINQSENERIGFVIRYCPGSATLGHQLTNGDYERKESSWTFQKQSYILEEVRKAKI